jgi:hypothetical protein
MKIAYEPHPVTPERKAELRALGFKIVDAAFKPADVEVLPDAVQQEIETVQVEVTAPAKRRGRPPKA